jgi:hypothetical protein
VLLILLLGVLMAEPALAGRNQERQWRWTTDERVVVVGDVHGAYTELLGVLGEAGLVDGEGHWSGGRDHLVMLGDLIDRGPQSREALDLVMRLQTEAQAAGGRVHMVLGNHEVMSLIGDLRYVNGDDWAAFAADEGPKERERYIKRRLSQAAALDGDVRDQRMILNRAFPPGFFARARAFAPNGLYGRWLLEQHVLLVINDVAFVHGGLSSRLLEIEAERINEVAFADLKAFIKAQRRLREAGVLGLELGLGEQLYRIRGLADQNGSRSSRLPGYARTMLEGMNGLTTADDGPLWYRGTALNPAGQEHATVRAVLDHIGADRVVVGHTPTHTGRLATRIGGAVIRADTGMLPTYYGGHAAAVVFEDGELQSLYSGEGLAALAVQRWELSLGSFDGADEVEMFLATAEVVDKADLGAGSTRPFRVTLADDGRRGQAVFKTIDVPTECHADPALSGCHDSYAHEVAAYRLDRALGLDMVPPTVVREIDGVVGSLQLMVENAVNENNRRDEDLQPPDPEGFAAQFRQVRFFDHVITNLDRSGSDVLITTHDWRLHLIDHSQAFEPADVVTAPDVPPELVERVRRLQLDVLREELDELLTPAELDALLARIEAARRSSGP